MKRLLVLATALTLVSLLLAAAATADRPDVERVIIGPFEVDSMCSFPVLLDPRGPNFFDLFDFNGIVRLNGPELVTAINLDTGTTLDLNISGQATFDFHDDGTRTDTFLGHTLNITNGLLINGREVVQRDSNGNVLSDTINGEQKNICPPLG
jgi:hypothetical protein